MKTPGRTASIQFTSVYYKVDILFICLHLLLCCSCFSGQKHISPVSPPESPQGPGVRHLFTYSIIQATKPKTLDKIFLSSLLLNSFTKSKPTL